MPSSDTADNSLLPEPEPEPPAKHSSDSDDEEPVSRDSNALPFVESLTKAASFKEAGNAAFKNKDFPLAQKCYQDGIDLLQPHKDLGGPSDDVTEEQFSAMISTYVGVQGNLCLLLFKQETWTEVLSSAAEVLKYDPKNVKALYRRGVAQHRLSCLEESRQSLGQALELDPANGPAKSELASVTKAIKAKKQKEKQALAGVFSSGSMYDDKEKERERRARRAREEEEKLQDDYVKAKLRRREEGKEEQTFEQYKAELKKEEEAKKKEREEEQKKQEKERAKNSVKRPPAPSSHSDSEDEYDEEEQKILKEAKNKGYCYFKNKLDEKTSELIGDITPKATTLAPPPAPLPSSSSSKVEASSWNHAGTWEERDVTAVTKTRLTEACLGVAVDLAADGMDDSSLSAALASLQAEGGSDSGALQRRLQHMSAALSRVQARIIEVKSLEGDAQIVLVGQGKKRQVYDFSLTLKFEVSVEDVSGDSSKNKKFRGSFELQDVAPGASYEHKTVFKKSGGAGDRVLAAVEQLRDKMLARVRTFFDNEYLTL